MKKILVILIVCSVSKLFAQDSTQVSNALVKKNQICIDPTYIVTGFLGGSNNLVRLGVGYRYRLNNRFEIRTSYDYEEYRYRGFYSQTQLEYIKDDTAYFSRHSWNSTTHYLRIGMQYNFGKRKLHPYVGLEIVNGLSRSNSDDVILPYALNNISAEIQVPEESSTFENRTYYHENDFYYKFGMSLVLGLDWQFHPRFAFGTKLNFDGLFNYWYKRINITRTPDTIYESEITPKTINYFYNTTPFSFNFLFRF